MSDRWYGYGDFKPEDRGSAPWRPDDPAVLRIIAAKVARMPADFGEGDEAVAREARRMCGIWNARWAHHLNADDVMALVAAGRLADLTHDFVPGEGWKPKSPFVVPTPEQVNAWSLAGFGHDSINQWVVARAELDRRGEPRECYACKGRGVLWASKKAKREHDRWKPTPVPTGDWWQVWETVSEGSPVTPAFATAAELIDHLVRHGDAWDQKRGNGGWGRESAERFVGKGWAPSGIAVPGVGFVTPRDSALLTPTPADAGEDRNG